MALPLFLLVLFTSCARLEEPEFRRIENLKVQKVGLETATIRLDVTFFNPNNFVVAVKEADILLQIDSASLGRFIQRSEVLVGAKSEFSIPLEGVIRLKTILESGPEKWIGKEVYVDANGVVRIGKGGVFIQREIRYGAWQKLDPGILQL